MVRSESPSSVDWSDGVVVCYQSGRSPHTLSPSHLNNNTCIIASMCLTPLWKLKIEQSVVLLCTFWFFWGGKLLSEKSYARQIVQTQITSEQPRCVLLTETAWKGVDITTAALGTECSFFLRVCWVFISTHNCIVEPQIASNIRLLQTHEIPLSTRLCLSSYPHTSCLATTFPFRYQVASSFPLIHRPAVCLTNILNCLFRLSCRLRSAV